MNKKGNITQVIKCNLCTSCGLCAINGRSKLVFKKGILVPVFQSELSSEESSGLYTICPGKGYPIVSIGQQLYDGKNIIYDYRFGYYQSVGVASSNNPEFLELSSSGGIIPTLANYLLENREIDGVVTVKFIFDNGITIRPFIAKSKNDIIESQGSKYLPVPLLEIIDAIRKFRGRLAVVGTPCQIAGLRLYQKKYSDINHIKYTISTFCGGFRDFRETKRIFRIYNVKEKYVTYFSYRGSGQPGFMTIKQNNKKDIKIKYPDYSRLTGYTKCYRCRTCIDAAGELADISCGDAWLERFLISDKKWSIYITRSKEMKEILISMKNRGVISMDSISEAELAASQKGNLTSKKERQNARYRLYKLLGKKLPEFDGGYPCNSTGLKLEVKIYFIGLILFILEKIKLYLPVSRLIKRVPL
jgi:coenzyme F420 hydrogenase subunit beta